MSGENAPTDPEKVETPHAPEAPAEIPTDLPSAAEKLGLTPDQLYELEVPMPDDEGTMKLGELKDAALAYKRERLEREAFETEKADQRANLERAREEIGQIVAMLPEAARTPEMLESARNQLAAVKQEQVAETLRRIPEWKDRTQFQADQEIMASHVEQHGFSQSEFANVFDARLIAYIRHNAKREARLNEMLSQMKAKRERQGGHSGSTKRPNAQKAATPKRGYSKDAALAAQLTDMLKEN
jgi:hypothetical protein